MGLILTDFFEPRSYDVEDTEVIVCDGCLAHLCLSSLVLSDQFWGLSGDAFLVDRLINILCEKQDLETSMRTGVYIINKIRCLQCSTKLGWHYKKSFKYSEYYKEGKYVIEKKYIRQIPNHSSTARLTEQAKLLKRRRSSASTTSS
ncbi:yippee-domain-containing protein, partial [Metschnikowia bicuspidata var. bicuspidata NRRL YB-4993]